MHTATTMQIHVLAGHSRGRRDAFSQSPVTFGRDPGNTVVVDESFVSRHHGELRFQDDAWLLVNLSPNGTKVGRHNVKGSPRPLREGDVIAVGDQPIMRVHLAPAAPAPEVDPEAQTPPQPASQSLGKRKKLWIGIGVYMFIMLALFVFFGTLKKNGNGAIKLAPELTDAQIAEAIRQAPPKVIPNELRAKEELQRAKELYATIDTSRRDLFNCYDAYRSALAYAGRQRFEGLEQLQYETVVNRLVDEVTKQYKLGYSRLRSGQFTEAVKALDELKTFYRDTQSPLYDNIERHLSVALSHAGKMKR